MPTYYRSDDKPVVQFDPRLEISPFQLLKRLGEGREILLVEAGSLGGDLTFEGSHPLPAADWLPPDDADVVLFDDADGAAAYRQAERLQAAGFGRVRALFGGLDLYRFALDPEVVGERTYLVERS